MPSQASNLTAIRTAGHWLHAYMSVFTGSVVLTATISATPTMPASNLAITVVSGSASNVKPGMRVEVFQSNGVQSKGHTRIRYAGTISSTNLPIRETSRGQTRIGSGDVIKVYSDIRLSDKLVAATSDFSPDQLTYSDEGSNPPPVVNSGGAWAGWDTMLPILMTGSASYNIDPDSGATVTHSWSLPSGLSYSSGGATSADPQLTGDAGEYWVPHTGTDASNSKSVIQYVPVRIHSSADPPYDVLIDTPEGEETAGWSARVRVVDAAGLAEIPDGAFVILWKQEYIAGTRQSFGAAASGRSHIILSGYLRREEAEADEEGVETLSFEVISPLARLEELVGYSKVMTSEATPDAWSEIKTLTTDRASIQLLQFYTNWTESGFDIIRSTYHENKTYPEFFLQRATPLGQLRELAKGVTNRIICDRRGRMEIQRRPEIIALTDRASVPVTLALTTRDLKRWRYTRDHWRELCQLTCSGFTAGSSSNQPLFSQWPGRAPAEGNRVETYERLIADDQDELNDWSGLIGASLDGIYANASNTIEQALDLELVLRGAYDVFDLYEEVVTVTLTTDLRGLDLSTQLFVLAGITIEYDEAGSAETTLRLRTCTSGVQGNTYAPPGESDNGLGDYDPPDYDNPPIDITAPTGNAAVWLDKGTQHIALIGTTGLSLTTNFGSGAATLWTTYSWASIHASPGTVLGWCPDALAPGFGWLVTNTKVLYVNLSAHSAVLKHTFATASSFRGIDARFDASAGYGIVIASLYAADVKVLYSTDNSTFTETAAIGSSGTGIAPAVHVSTKAADQATLGAFASANVAKAYRSTDEYANWSALSNPLMESAVESIREMHCPWHNNPADALYYFSARGGASNLERIWRTNGASAPTDITPSVGGVIQGRCLPRGGIQSYVGNRLRMYAAAHSSSDSVKYCFRSDDAGDNWTQLTAAGTTYNRVFPSGDNADTLYLAGNRSGSIAAIGLSNDGGMTIVSQQGNLVATDVGDILGIAGY